MKDIKEIKEILKSKSDPKFVEFSSNLNICKGYRSLGVRIPVLRDYAKVLSKEYPLDYLMENIDEEYYEEILLKGFIIGNYKKLTYEELIYYIEMHLPKITDWSMCDTFAASLKITSKYKDKLWNYINEKLNSKEEFEVRFALVMLLDYYIDDEYKDKIFDIIKNVKLEDYYVKMANAWLLSYMFINYFDDTVNFIKKVKMDKWTLSKGIRKAQESYRVSNENKKILGSISRLCK